MPDEVRGGSVGAALDGLPGRFVAMLELPAADGEVHDVAVMLQGALESALRTDQAELLDDALRLVHGQLVARGLLWGNCREISDALAAAAAPSLTGAERERVHSLLLRCGQDPTSVPAKEPTSLGSKAAEYVNHLIKGDRQGALELTRRCVIEGMGMFEILLDVLEPAQYEVGRLWEIGQISIAQEHFCTAVTQFVMTDLYPGFFSGEESQRRLVAVHAPGSTHHVGLRMVIDILECSDWRTSYFADDVSVESLPTLVAEERADLLLISASMPSHIPEVRSMIAAVRADPRTQRVKVVVGGRPFGIDPDLVEAVGADGWARDGRSAVDVCNALVGAKNE